jgi:hypothetical protein
MATTEITMNERFARLKKEVEGEMDLDAIWEEEYKAALAEEMADDVRTEARKEAEADIRKRRTSK